MEETPKNQQEVGSFGIINVILGFQLASECSFRNIFYILPTLPLWLPRCYPSSRNHGSGKWVPPIWVSFHLGWFFTSMIVGERVSLVRRKYRPQKPWKAYHMAPSSCFRNLAVTTTAERMLEEIPHHLLYMKPYGKTADSPSFHINNSASVGKTRTSTSKLLGIPTESAFSKAWRGKLTGCRVIHGFNSKLHINSMRYTRWAHKVGPYQL